MQNSEINNKIKNYVSNNCSPEIEIISFISNEYKFLSEVLGGRTFQSGSYGRGTAIRQVNDLDVIWVLPSNIRKSIDVAKIDISNILTDTANEIRKAYQIKGKNITVEPQKHSVLIQFPDREDDFSVDIVPAIELSEKNLCGDYFFSIPEVGLLKRNLRQNFYDTHENTDWIKTDPKGYIFQTNSINEKFNFFKDIVKLIKTWKGAWKKKYKEKGVEFKLKSFHIEQIVYEHLISNESNSSEELLIEVLRKIPNYLIKPSIKDRAQDFRQIRYIDEYVNDLSEQQKSIVKFAVDSAIALYDLIKKSEKDIGEYLDRLLSPEEMICAYKYTFDDNTIQDRRLFYVDGYVKPENGLVSGYIRKTKLLADGLTKGKNSRRIVFETSNKTNKEGVEYWKVRNTGTEAKEADSLRGEINIRTTLMNPEKTHYTGNHYVTCYLIDEISRKVIAYDTLLVKVK